MLEIKVLALCKFAITAGQAAAPREQHSSTHHAKPLRAMGPTVNGCTMALYSPDTADGAQERDRGAERAGHWRRP